MINTVLQIIGLILIAIVTLFAVCACMLSSMISEKERRENNKGR